MAALFRSERPWYVFKLKKRYVHGIAIFFKKTLKVICALAGILIPVSVSMHPPHPDSYAQQLCAVKTALCFFRRVSSLYVTLCPSPYSSSFAFTHLSKIQIFVQVCGKWKWGCSPSSKRSFTKTMIFFKMFLKMKFSPNAYGGPLLFFNW